jgi:guanylate kinase
MTEDNPYNRPYHPLLLVISGPSGVGKDTIARMLINERNNFHFVVTATTRPPRPGEKDGEDYIFLTTDQFAQKINEEQFLEWALVYNDYKGVLKEQITNALASGKDAIMRVDPQGAATIRHKIPQTVSVFLMAESEEAMFNRLRARKSDTLEGIMLRTATARQEMKRISEFDYAVINAEGMQQETVARVLAIVDAEHCRVGRTRITL